MVALRMPSRITEKVVRPLRDFGLERPNTKIVVADQADTGKRIFLLREGIVSDALPDQVRDILKQHDEIEVTKSDVELSESNFTLEELLRSVVPGDLELPSSYEAVGHIAHLNLRKELLPYKQAIGEAFLAKLNQIKTVVNKLDTIHEVFRTFEMEVLAGEDRFEVELMETNCRFRFDFRKVYWNSRLQVEHLRIVEACSERDVVCDAFAGIGPFAIPLAKKGVRVLANDLNPASYESLVANAKLNKVQLEAYNLDAREFIQSLCTGKSTFAFTAVLMNLPKDAVEFLDAFVGCMPELEADATLPRIFCYAFCKPSDEGDDLVARVRAALSIDPDEELELNIKKIRDISPKKFMFCVEFSLPRSVVVQTVKRRKVGAKSKD